MNISKKIKISYLFWIGSVLIFLLLSLLFSFFSSQTILANILGTAFLIIIGVGGISFLIFFILTLLFLIKGNNKGKLIKLIKIPLISLILPVLLLKNTVLPIRELKRIGVFKNLIWAALFSIFLFPLWISGYIVVGVISSQFVVSQLGYSAVSESIVGTGSMYPTFPKGNKLTPKEQYREVVAQANFISYPSGIVVMGKRYFGRELKRGDIITFQNKKTEDETKKSVGIATGFLKRLIALPGDTLMLKSGIVYLNEKPLKEPYIAKPRSTFGEDFLSECTLIKVPKDKIFAMGDNRKGSGDSREIGFVDLKDVEEVLPLEVQKGVWDKHWRDTTKDFEEASKIKINKEKYLELLNEKRKEAGVQLLKYEPKLEKSASLRGESIIKFDDFSFTATKSGYTMRKAMLDSGYSNIVYGEAPTQGYYDADELIDNQFQFSASKTFLLNKNYQDFGISEVEGEINGCPTQVVVQHFAGYVPPNYSPELIKSWEDALNNLRNIQPSWQDLKNSPIYEKDKADVDRINDVISQRVNMISSVVTKMKANQWLSAAEDQYTKVTDEQLGKEENQLADKLNSIH